MRWTVLTASRSPRIGDGLTYESALPLAPGLPVRVPLRKGVVEGIVLAAKQEREKRGFAVKEISEMIGDEPLLTAAQVAALGWMARHYRCTPRQALGVFLPSAPWSRLLPRMRRGYTLTGRADVGGSKQVVVVDAMRPGEWTPEEMLRTETGASPATLRSLVRKGILREESRREHEAELRHSLPSGTAPLLTPLQETACASIEKEQRPALLFGVTGSGKTEIYARLILDVVRRGRQAILLVPEILLTEHCVERFTTLLGTENVAVIHSKIGDASRRDAWRRIRSGEVRLVIGSRSALFAPCADLGLVVVDEEHEWTYKNEQAPRYHARETAETLCRAAGAKLVLGSATPSTESWSRVKDGRYALMRLPERYQGTLPSVRVIDLGDVRFGNLYPFSPPLLEALQHRLERREQSVLLLNHRGVASALLCLECRQRILSPESRLPLTLHHGRGGAPVLVDHVNGMTLPVPAVCPHCGAANLLPVGAGTQKIELLLKRLLPSARLLRADRDTLRTPQDMRAMLSAVRERKADILLGTESVAKGLDLPGVTLAAVLVADLGLSLPHFRAGERVFQLLTQLTGRSGRATPGEVIVQTFRPDAPEVRFATTHDTEGYLEYESKVRALLRYPPVTSMARFLVRGRGAEGRAATLLSSIRAAGGKDASAAPTFAGGGKEWHVLVRAARLDPILDAVAVPPDVALDVDPMDCL